MFRRCAFLLTLITAVTNTHVDSLPESMCEVVPSVVGENGVSIYGRKESSDWVTTILSHFQTEGSADNPNLEVGQKIFKCNGKDIVQIKAVLRVPLEQREKDYQNTTGTTVDGSLRFQESGGKNILVFNNGLTVYRKNEEAEQGFAAILTKRHLKDEELFEVKLDRCITKFGTNIGMGVTTLSPTTIEYGQWISSGAIMLYNNNIYGGTPKSNYGPNLRTLKAGAHIGVKRMKNGNIHFYVNGVDQGIAAINIASPVYGVFDLYGDAVQASIVNTK